jgi:hypothetical protein
VNASCASAVLFLASLQCTCVRNRDAPASPRPDSENSVAAFLKNAERQAETDEQRKEIQRALRDMLEKPAVELRLSITQLLQHYFVPNPPAALDEEHFFRDVRAPAARAAVQHQLDEVSRALR